MGLPRVSCGPVAPAFHEHHDDELLALEDVAQILKTSENTVRWWRQTGTGPGFFKIGRRLSSTVGDLRRFIRPQRLAFRYGWGKTKGPQNLKDRELVPQPVMTHPDRWRLD